MIRGGNALPFRSEIALFHDIRWSLPRLQRIAVEVTTHPPFFPILSTWREHHADGASTKSKHTLNIDSNEAMQETAREESARFFFRRIKQVSDSMLCKRKVKKLCEGYTRD